MKKLLLIALIITGIIQCADPSCSMDIQDNSADLSFLPVDEEIHNVITRVQFCQNIHDVLKLSTPLSQSCAPLSEAALEKTKTWYEHVLPRIKKDRKAYGSRLKELGLIHMGVFDSDKALTCLQKAYKIHQNESMPCGHLLELTASIHFHRNEPQKGIEGLLEAIALLQKEHKPIGYTLWLLHTVYVEQDDQPKAEASWPVTLQALHRENLPYAHLLMEMGWGAMKNKKIQEATGWFEKAIPALEREQTLLGENRQHQIATCKRRITVLETFTPLETFEE